MFRRFVAMMNAFVFWLARRGRRPDRRPDGENTYPLW
jgi:hypothetical protein